MERMAVDECLPAPFSSSSPFFVKPQKLTSDFERHFLYVLFFLSEHHELDPPVSRFRTRAPFLARSQLGPLSAPPKQPTSLRPS